MMHEVPKLLVIRLHAVTAASCTIPLCIVLLSPCRGDWVKPGAVVLDVGINVVPFEASHTSPLARKDSNIPGLDGDAASTRCDNKMKPGDGRIVGDVAYREVSWLASAVTPVPGGVGPMTIAALIHNVVLAAQYRSGFKQW